MLCGMTMAPSMPSATRMLAPSTEGITQLRRRRRPVGLHEEELDDVAAGDDREEDDDHALEPMVLLPEDGDEDDADGERRADPERQPEEEIEAESGPEVLGQVGRHAGQHDGDAGDPDDGLGQLRADVGGQGVAGDDAQLGREVLQEDEHERAERDDPQQRVAELRPAGDVGRPVAGVDEADGDDEPGAQVAEQLAREQIADEVGGSVRPGVGLQVGRRLQRRLEWRGGGRVRLRPPGPSRLRLGLVVRVAGHPGDTLPCAGPGSCTPP